MIPKGREVCVGWVAALALAMLIGSASQPSGLGWASLPGGPAIARAQGAGSTDYLIRLLAFVLILLAVIDKNRAAAR